MVLHDWLREHDVDLSPDQIRRILHDPIYCDGRYAVHDHDDLVLCRPAWIPQEERIPQQLLQANVELLACQKGPHTKTPVGAFCLNGIKVRHAPCATKTHKSGQPFLLKGRSWQNQTRTYIHMPGNPCGGRYSVRQDVLEPAVMRALRELADDPELQQAWAAASGAEPETQSAPSVFGEADQARLREKISNLEREYTRLNQELMSKITEGGRAEAAERAFLDSLEEQRSKLQDQLDLAERHETRQLQRPEPKPGRTHVELRRALEDVLTDAVPDDERMRIRRMAVVECCLSEIIVHDVAGDDGEAGDRVRACRTAGAGGSGRSGGGPPRSARCRPPGTSSPPTSTSRRRGRGWRGRLGWRMRQLKNSRRRAPMASRRRLPSCSGRRSWPLRLPEKSSAAASTYLRIGRD